MSTSSSSSSSSSSFMNSTQPNSSSSMNITQPTDNNEQIEPARARTGTYPCPRCDKTFSTPMAMGGHQNAHREAREAEKRLAETQRDNPFSMTPSGSLMVNPFSVQSITNRPGTMVGTSYPGINWRYVEEFQAKRRREEYARALMLSALPRLPSATPAPPASAAHAPLRPVPQYPPPSASLAPPPRASLQTPSAIGSTRFFGVPDFFGPSVATTAPLGDGASSGRAIVVDSENEDEEENALDLDLKL